MVRIVSGSLGDTPNSIVRSIPLSEIAPTTPITKPYPDQPRTARQHRRHDARPRRAERRTQTDFAPSFRHPRRRHAIEARGDEDQRNRGENRQESQHKLPLRHHLGHHLAHRAWLIDGDSRVYRANARLKGA